MRAGSRCLWGAALALLPLAGHAGERLIVVSSSDAAVYAAALAGIRQMGYPVDVVLAGNDPDPVLAAAITRAGSDAAIVTLGASAAAAVLGTAPAAPVVHCMEAGSGDRRLSHATVSVPLALPVDVEIAWLKRLLPAAQRVGILFDPTQNERLATDGAVALRRAGYRAVLEPIATPAALPQALARLAGSVDVLLAMPDATVFAREHQRALLLFSFRNRIPLAGPSEAWVRAGALYAIDWDYADLGRYCGALALRQLAGARGSHPAPPRTRVLVNPRSAGQLRVQWDAETLRTVEKVAM